VRATVNWKDFNASERRCRHPLWPKLHVLRIELPKSFWTSSPIKKPTHQYQP